jgi:hypothetical protein
MPLPKCDFYCPFLSLSKPTVWYVNDGLKYLLVRIAFLWINILKKIANLTNQSGPTETTGQKNASNASHNSQD